MRKNSFDIKSIITVIAFTFVLVAVPLGVYYFQSTTDNRSQASSQNKNIDPRVGVTFAGAPKSEMPSLSTINGGLDAIQSSGFTTMEVYLSREVCWPSKDKPYGLYAGLDFCDNANTMTLKDVAETDMYRKVLSRDFHTLFITTESFLKQSASAFRIAVTEEDLSQSQLDSLYNEFYDFTVHLYEEYSDGSGRTIVLQTPNELEWHLVANKPGDHDDRRYVAPDQFAINNAVKYINTISKAISDAKRDAARPGLRILHGCEVNVVSKGKRGIRSAMTDVIPKTRCDLYGYSAYDTALTEDINDRSFVETLDYFAKQAPDSDQFGDKNIYISEFGVPANNRLYADQYSQLITKRIDESLRWGVPYVLYWTFAETKNCGPKLTECPGYALKRADGSNSPGLQILQSYNAEKLAAEFVREEKPLPDSVRVGQRFPINLVYKNTGVLPWSASSLFRMGGTDPETRAFVPRLDMEKNRVINSRQIGAFRGVGVAPDEPGVYTLTFRPLMEWYTFFGESVELEIRVTE